MADAEREHRPVLIGGDNEPELVCGTCAQANRQCVRWSLLSSLPKGKYVVVETDEGWDVYGDGDPVFT